MLQSFYRQAKYLPVQETDDVKELLSEASSADIDLPLSTRRSWPSFALIAVVLLFSLCIFVLGAFVGTKYPQDLDSTCTEHTSKYSPVMENVDITYQKHDFDGSFSHPNVYRGDAGPEVDAAWEAIGADYSTIQIPTKFAEKAGFTKEDNVMINEKYGGGYFAIMEGIHHIHCLNLVRKSLYFNYEYYHSRAQVEFSDPDWMQKLHITHCLDILRQQLQCQPNIGIFGSNWIRNGSHTRPFVDFNTAHTCRNWADIQEWARVRQVPEEDAIPLDYVAVPTWEVNIHEGVP